MCCRAKADLDNHLSVSHEWSHFCDSLDHKKIIQAPFCGDGDCEDKIKKDSARYKIRKMSIMHSQCSRESMYYDRYSDAFSDEITDRIEIQIEVDLLVISKLHRNLI